MASTLVLICPCCPQRPILTITLVREPSYLRALDFFWWNIKKVVTLREALSFCGIKTPWNEMCYGCVWTDCCVFVEGSRCWRGLRLIRACSPSNTIRPIQIHPTCSVGRVRRRVEGNEAERFPWLRVYISTDHTRGADSHWIPVRRDMCSWNGPIAVSADSDCWIRLRGISRDNVFAWTRAFSTFALSPFPRGTNETRFGYHWYWS